MERNGTDAFDILVGRGGMDYFQGGEHRASLGLFPWNDGHKFIQYTLDLQLNLYSSDAIYFAAVHNIRVGGKKQGMPHQIEWK